jgi:hypothetical protein
MDWVHKAEQVWRVHVFNSAAGAKERDAIFVWRVWRVRVVMHLIVFCDFYPLIRHQVASEKVLLCITTACIINRISTNVPSTGVSAT